MRLPIIYKDGANVIRTKEHKYAFWLLVSFLFVFNLSGCTIAPTKSYELADRARMQSVRRIVVLIPKMDGHAARVRGDTVPSGWLLKLLAEESIEKVKNSGDDIKKRAGNKKIEEDFAAALKLELERRNYVVSLLMIEDSLPTDYGDVDAVLTIGVVSDYASPGFANPFTRNVTIYANLDSIVQGKKSEPLFTSTFRYQNRASDTYKYFTYDALLKDAPNAVMGLRNAMIDLVPEIGNALRKS